MNRRSISVEFFGMPGVGKSMLSNRVAEIIRQREILVEQRMYALAHQISRARRVVIKSIHVMKDVLLNTRYTILSTKAIIATKQRSMTDLIGVLFNWLFVSSFVRRDRHFHGIRLLEEGIFQALWSIGFSSKRGVLAIMKTLSTWIPTPTIVIIVEASHATIEHRLHARPGQDSRLERQLAGDPAPLRLSNILVEEIKTILRTSEWHKQVHVLMVNNDQADDFEVNANRIVDYIEPIYRRIANGD
jgi:broad-specificity NMP kinase